MIVELVLITVDDDIALRAYASPGHRCEACGNLIELHEWFMVKHYGTDEAFIINCNLRLRPVNYLMEKPVAACRRC